MISKGLMESAQENIGQTWHKLTWQYWANMALENCSKDFHIQLCDEYKQVLHKVHLTIN